MYPNISQLDQLKFTVQSYVPQLQVPKSFCEKWMPLNLMVNADALLQRTGALISPSIFIKATRRPELPHPKDFGSHQLPNQRPDQPLIGDVSQVYGLWAAVFPLFSAAHKQGEHRNGPAVDICRFCTAAPCSSFRCNHYQVVSFC